MGTRLILKMLGFPFLGAGKLALQGGRTWVPSSLGFCCLLALCEYRVPSRWHAWEHTLTANCFQSWGTDGLGKAGNALQPSLNEELFHTFWVEGTRGWQSCSKGFVVRLSLHNKLLRDLVCAKHESFNPRESPAF